MFKRQLDSQEGVLYFSYQTLSAIPTPSSVTCNACSKTVALQRFWSSLYDDIVTLVEALKNEVCALKSRSDMLKKIIKNLQSKCDTHERTLETFRQHIVDLHRYQGTLDLSYQGEEFESVS